eukprot:1907097-Alexandrium_andersonii.AAC.1
MSASLVGSEMCIRDSLSPSLSLTLSLGARGALPVASCCRLLSLRPRAASGLAAIAVAAASVARRRGPFEGASPPSRACLALANEATPG